MGGVWMLRVIFFFFKQKTAYEMHISDWSSDVCSSDLLDVLKIANRHRGDVVLGEQREPFRGRLRRRLARDFAVDDRHMLALCLGGLEFGRLDRKSTRLNSSH